MIKEIARSLGLFYLAAYGASASDTTLPALPAVESCKGHFNLNEQAKRALAFFCSSDELRSKNREAAIVLPSLRTMEDICNKHWDPVNKACKEDTFKMFQKLAETEERKPQQPKPQQHSTL